MSVSSNPVFGTVLSTTNISILGGLTTQFIPVSNLTGDNLIDSTWYINMSTNALIPSGTIGDASNPLSGIYSNQLDIITQEFKFFDGVDNMIFGDIQGGKIKIGIGNTSSNEATVNILDEFASGSSGINDVTPTILCDNNNSQGFGCVKIKNNNGQLGIFAIGGSSQLTLPTFYQNKTILASEGDLSIVSSNGEIFIGIDSDLGQGLSSVRIKIDSNGDIYFPNLQTSPGSSGSMYVTVGGDLKIS